MRGETLVEESMGLDHGLLLIDPRAYQQLLDVMRVKRLAESDPQLIGLVQTININRPSMVDMRAWTVLQERVQAIIGALQERPYLPPPPIMQEGEVIIGMAHNGMPVRIRWEDLTRHALFAASSGGGKTTLLHFLLHQALYAGIKVWALDAKKDARYLAARANFLIASALRYNPLARPSFIKPALHREIIASCFCRAFFGHETTKSLVTELLKALFGRNEHASIADFKALVDETYTIKETFTRRDANRGLAAKLDRLIGTQPTLCNTREGLPAAFVCANSLYYDVDLLTEGDEFLFSLLVHQLFAYQEARNARSALDVLLVVDEGLLSFGNETTSTTNSRISGPALGALHGMIREFSLGMLLTTTSIRTITPVVKTSVFLHAAMGLSDGNEADEITKTYGLNPEQREYLTRHIKTGEAVYRLNDQRWRHPMLLTFPKLDPAMKTVTNEDWQTAIERTRNLYQEPSAPEVATELPPTP